MSIAKYRGKEQYYPGRDQILKDLSKRFMSRQELLTLMTGFGRGVFHKLGVPDDTVWFEVVDGLWCEPEHVSHMLTHCTELRFGPSLENLESRQEFFRYGMALPTQKHWEALVRT